MQVMKKFEARWLEEEECSERVRKAWERAVEGEVNLMEIQSQVLRELWQWDREVLGGIGEKNKKCQE